MPRDERVWGGGGGDADIINFFFFFSFVRVLETEAWIVRRRTRVYVRVGNVAS